MNIVDELKARGFVAQISHEEALYEYLETPGVFYIGFDPTADSLHAGHLFQMILMAHMQRAGHRPIALLGGGTGMVGDPSDRTDMRAVLSPDVIEHNVSRFRDQMSLLLDFSAGRAIVENNASWLLPLNYVQFLREIGAVFSVNKMLTAEAYRQRLEKGLTFLEFNYMLMQAYDFLELYRRHNCRLQIGGNDQWSNILAGVDLVRRKEQAEVYALTTNLLVTSTGQKMGKTAKGALWLDGEKTPPYEFYQYWRNVDDESVDSLLKRLTFLPLDEIEDLTSVSGSAINEAKRRLALELTEMVHGEAAAQQADQTAAALFAGAGSAENMETYRLTDADQGAALIDVLTAAGLFPSKSEGRRLIRQGGVTLNGEKISDTSFALTEDCFADGEAIVKKGKKNYLKLLWP
ncbi:MAG TPA: tyrosine--tRNA ligase [Clostridiaceae bacterium]|jgi:tyrosyl-tRNA synthetase|nr:tyrosine--tRNA ligase [Clostridiaceae bacterium]